MKIAKLLPLLLFLVQPLNAQQLMREPDGLEPGDQYRLAFITSTARDATSSNIEDYNHFVQALADAAPVVGSWSLEWKAIGSTTLVSARDNTNTNNTVEQGVPIYRLDGELIWRDYIHMWETEMGDKEQATNALNYTELGTVVEEFVWTGANHDGNSPRVLPATGRSGALGDNDPIVGHPLGGFAPWRVGLEPASLEFPMLAISEVITVVPEPSGITSLSTVGILFFAFRERRHRKRYIPSDLEAGFLALLLK